ncbi:arylamine N-acetyltransferase [Pseudoalteromonas sp. SMS1]|uniref:arylamine N-acetyltransferase family protein n=1 Tax=Pseudoalteromonas sp. SMS1 TaxID=2908894 RepID=UPI001F1F0E11|nr:arylamine N-acetyltransferase [Pseudoalteromonas sp. SMS1]MCF2859315.1 arylamine N-acetyltransferase [Pseudoalteromonas sp. SMS1]
MNQTQLAIYLSKLDIQDAISNDLILVGKLIQAHINRFSFSSFNAMQNKILSTSDDELFERLIVQQQGGYCFEHNKIAMLALRAMGFNVSPLLGRVLLNGTKTNARTHRLTQLTFQGNTYLVDVGFGVKTPRIPIPIERSANIAEGINEYHIKRTANSVTVSLLEPERVTLYQVDLLDTYESDCDVGHFYSHQHPEASFVNNLVVSRISEHERFVLRNLSYLYFNERSGEHIERSVDSVEQLCEILRKTFYLAPMTDDVRWVFDKVNTRRLQAN